MAHRVDYDGSSDALADLEQQGSATTNSKDLLSTLATHDKGEPIMLNKSKLPKEELPVVKSCFQATNINEVADERLGSVAISKTFTELRQKKTE